jgi:hypothetical protein
MNKKNKEGKPNITGHMPSVEYVEWNWKSNWSFKKNTYLSKITQISLEKTTYNLERLCHSGLISDDHHLLQMHMVCQKIPGIPPAMAICGGNYEHETSGFLASLSENIFCCILLLSDIRYPFVIYNTIIQLYTILQYIIYIYQTSFQSPCLASYI